MHVYYDKSMTYICHGRRERDNQEKTYSGLENQRRYWEGTTVIQNLPQYCVCCSTEVI